VLKKIRTNKRNIEPQMVCQVREANQIRSATAQLEVAFPALADVARRSPADPPPMTATPEDRLRYTTALRDYMHKRYTTSVRCFGDEHVPGLEEQLKNVAETRIDDDQYKMLKRFYRDQNFRNLEPDAKCTNRFWKRFTKANLFGQLYKAQTYGAKHEPRAQVCVAYQRKGDVNSRRDPALFPGEIQYFVQHTVELPPTAPGSKPTIRSHTLAVIRSFLKPVLWRVDPKDEAKKGQPEKPMWRSNMIPCRRERAPASKWELVPLARLFCQCATAPFTAPGYKGADMVAIPIYSDVAF
jgi:hypothetical protein